MLFSPSPKVCRSWLLATPVPRTHTFSQSLSKLVIGVHYTPIITRTPSSTSTPTPHTNYTPTIHNPTTPPIPLLLRVDSDEMWQKQVGFWLMRHWNARKGPRMGPKVHEVDTARRTNKARACSMSVCCERGRKRRWMRCTARMGRLRILPRLRRHRPSSRKP